MTNQFDVHTIMMDTSVLFGYFFNFGYDLVRKGQFKEWQIEKLQGIMKTREKIMPKYCLTQIEDNFYKSFPESFESGKRRNSKATISIKDGCNPITVLDEIKKTIDEDFKMYNEKGMPTAYKTEICSGAIDYIRDKYLQNPTSPESCKWIEKKRNTLPVIEYDEGLSESDLNRMYIREIAKKAKNNRDLDMLALAGFLSSDSKIVFISRDSDHINLSKYMWHKTEGKVMVMSLDQALKYVRPL